MTEPLARLAAVIWQRAPALGEGGRCSEAGDADTTSTHSRARELERRRPIRVTAFGPRRTDKNGAWGLGTDSGTRDG